MINILSRGTPCKNLEICSSVRNAVYEGVATRNVGPWLPRNYTLLHTLLHRKRFNQCFCPLMLAQIQTIIKSNKL